MPQKEIGDYRVKQISLFSKFFWGTIIILFIGFIVLIVLAMLNAPDGSLEDARQKRAYKILPPIIEKGLPQSIKDMIPKFAKNITQKGVQQTFSKSFYREINHKIDQAFLPVEANIPKFVNAHYSVLGEYVELGVAATGKLGEHIENQLFPGLQERLDRAVVSLSAEMHHNIQINIDQYTQEVLSTTEQTLTQNQLKEFADILAENLTKNMKSMRMSAAWRNGATDAVAGIAGTKLIAATIARKLIIKLSAKLATKMAMKSGGAAASAAAGAAIGSVVPGFGTAIGGVIGGVAGWLLTDKAFVSVDEWLHRDEFERHVRNMVIQQKNKIKISIRKKIQFIENNMLENIKSKSTEGKTPAEIISGV